MKQLVLHNWNLIRVLRLAMGIAILVQAVLANDVLFGMIGILFTAMPVFNLGCCAGGNCSAPVQQYEDNAKEIIYEEVV